MVETFTLSDQIAFVNAVIESPEVPDTLADLESLKNMHYSILDSLEELQEMLDRFSEIEKSMI